MVLRVKLNTGWIYDEWFYDRFKMTDAFMTGALYGWINDG
jgi:hypothetical protein